MGNNTGSRLPTLEIRDERRTGFYQTDNEIIRHFGKYIGPFGIAVYSALAMHAGSKEKSWPGRKFLAEEIGVSVPTVDKAIKVLKTYGLIRVENRHNEQGQASNLYTLTDQSEWQWVNDVYRGEETTFTHPCKPRLHEQYSLLNNTQLEQDTSSPPSSLPEPKPKEQNRIDNQNIDAPLFSFITDYWRRRVAGKKKLSQAEEDWLWELYQSYTGNLLYEAIVEAARNNKYGDKPTYNFVRSICQRLDEQRRTDTQRKTAIQLSVPPSSASSPAYQTDTLFAREREELLKEFGNGNQIRKSD